jgi:hypothetical protein
MWLILSLGGHEHSVARLVRQKVFPYRGRRHARGEPDVPLPWGIAVVRGRSMEPTLHEGDRLLVRHGGTPRPGMLAVVRLPERPVAVKRVTRRTPDGWWVERDNAAEGVDSWLVGAVPAENVVAIVVARLWPLRGRPPLNRR